MAQGLSEKVKGSLQSLHPVKGMNNQMVPMMMVLAFGGQNVGGYIALWLFQSLFLAAFMFFSQMFLLLFGPAGMLLNIICLSLQLVSSGAMVPRELLPGFYQGASKFLPATYAVDGIMSLLFGGPSVGPSARALVLILGLCFGAGFLAAALRKPRTAEEKTGKVASNRHKKEREL